MVRLTRYCLNLKKDFFEEKQGKPIDVLNALTRRWRGNDEHGTLRGTLLLSFACSYFLG
jgi:hypothetical protein